jgi:cytochrome c biogenesis protein CcdA
MKKKPNSGEATLHSIRRNSAYSKSRVLTLIFTVVFGFSMILIAYLISTELPKSEKAIILLIGALLGGFGGMSFLHFLHAHYDQSDALIQVAKFQERSLTRRNDALSLVEKIRQEVEEEKLDKIVDSDVKPIERSSSETSDEERKEQEKSSEGEKDKTAD